MMSDEPLSPALEQLTEITAEAIIFTVSAATTGDPKPEIMRLLRNYLAEAQQQEFNDALRSQQREEQNQQS